MNKDLIFHFLVIPYEGKFLALCKETGISRAGDSLEAARDALLSSTQVLVEEVNKEPRFEPSLTIGLPLRYQILFHWTVLKISFRFMVDKIMYQTKSIQDFSPRFA